jgi:hypothetical protein
MMGFRTAKSTIIPAVFDLAPNRQITANWQIRRHGAGRGEPLAPRNTKPAVEGGPVSGKAGKPQQLTILMFPENLNRCKRIFACGEALLEIDRPSSG